jgi:hypothetical protein
VGAFATRGEASAPEGRYVDGTLDGIDAVTDTKTHLIWQRAATPDASFGEAQASCATLPGAGWRLPSVSELLTIINDDGRLEESFPVLDDALWTSSPMAGVSGVSWVVVLEHGQTIGDFVDNPHGARCVR